MKLVKGGGGCSGNGGGDQRQVKRERKIATVKLSGH